MIVLARRTALYLFGLAAVALAPFLFFLWDAWLPSAPYLPPIVAAEFLIYLLFAMMASPQAGWPGASVAGLTLLVLRAGLNLAGAATLVLGAGRDFGQSWLQLQFGNPLSIGAQMLLGLFYAPYILYPFFPGILTPEAARDVEEARAPAPAEAPPAGQAPIGGYIQAYSYAELAEALRQAPGLEAYVVYAADGAKLGASSRLSWDESQAIHASGRLIGEARHWAEALRFGSVEKVALETSDHRVYDLAVNPRTRLLLVFRADAPIVEIIARLDMLKRTVFEFLRVHGEEADLDRSGARA